MRSGSGDFETRGSVADERPAPKLSAPAAAAAVCRNSLLVVGMAANKLRLGRVPGQSSGVEAAPLTHPRLR